MHLNKMECRGLEVLGVWSWYVDCVPSAEEKSRWSQSSVSGLGVVVVLSCKDRRWPLSSVCFVFTALLVAGGLVLVCDCVVVCLWFECFFTTRSWPLTESTDKSSSPELKCVHLPTGGAGGAPLTIPEDRRRRQEGKYGSDTNY